MFIAEREGNEPILLNRSNLIVYQLQISMVYDLGNFNTYATLYVLSTFCLHVTQVQR